MAKKRLSHDVVPAEGGGFRYRLLEGTRVTLTSGVFHEAHDADAVGQHFAANPELRGKGQA